MGEASSDVTAVRVLAVSRVAPRAAAGEDAGGRVKVKLSFMDSFWVMLPPIQRVFLYELRQEDEFPAVVERLKRALADTLAHYIPLAGKLEHEADTGDVWVNYYSSDADAGVAFVEAESDGMDVRRLATDESHDVPAFQSLVPELDASALPAPVLSVQATRLGAGTGVAVGISVHHALADGKAVWRFMEAWASASREGSPVTAALGAPHYSREDAIPHPEADELARGLLKAVAPNLPVVNSAKYDFSQRFLRERRTFFLDADDIKSLKQRIDGLAMSGAEAGAPKPKPVSTFVALAALGWTAFVRSKGLGAGDDTYLAFLADLRARLDPPVADGYLGNCVRACMASCPDAAELLGEGGILRAARAVQAAVKAMEAAPLAGTDKGAINAMMRLPFNRLANVAASPRFKAYEASDFGFGKPARVELVSMNHDGEMVLVGGRRDGEVQVSVSVDPAHMDAFKAWVLGCSR
ncbi:phenolic glucoside malonyltransferase 1 [Brachypodium distachyon]|uniref:Uncharacterized protein n=1 Tax=Brachypodium distachyon TaxID=15368 RepID=I1I163_BRADI|nr:phenolic glucoside malonyltransferase 1 [Brachypodium distachyon]KQJ95203.1 hypothetical protein BRADI_3g15750v3 [Brachypodium distachyon]|eukprot:XP_003571426.1 phenolic glucoside malonyltransferase 1 [Brachypodium distachyon]